jgi:predicted kinase
MVGPPGAGKSTYIKNLNTDDLIIISRDDELMAVATREYGDISYSEAWKKLSEEEHKEIDKNYKEKFEDAKKYKKNILVDMTNMSAKSQRRWVNSVGRSYTAKATVFMTDYYEVFNRLEKRAKEEDKHISKDVIHQMMKSFMVPNYSVFDEISFAIS